MAAFFAFLAAWAASFFGRFFSFGAGCLATVPPLDQVTPAAGGLRARHLDPFRFEMVPLPGEGSYRGMCRRLPYVAQRGGMYTPEKRG